MAAAAGRGGRSGAASNGLALEVPASAGGLGVGGAHLSRGVSAGGSPRAPEPGQPSGSPIHESTRFLPTGGGGWRGLAVVVVAPWLAGGVRRRRSSGARGRGRGRGSAGWLGWLGGTLRLSYSSWQQLRGLSRGLRPHGRGTKRSPRKAREPPGLGSRTRSGLAHPVREREGVLPSRQRKAFSCSPSLCLSFGGGEAFLPICASPRGPLAPLPAPWLSGRWRMDGFPSRLLRPSSCCSSC